MDHPDFRQEKQYRRGLILGLTIAEIMILLIFLLLMALASALAAREAKVKALDAGGASKLVEAVQQAYPDAKTSDEFYKELVRSIQTRKAVEQTGLKGAQERLQEYADVGQSAVEAAERSGFKDPRQFVENALKKAAAGKKGEWPPFFSLSEAGGYYFESGKATLKPAFDRNLRTVVVPLLRKNIDDYGVDVVEVIGHTDEVPMSGQSNLDSRLIAASASQFPIGALQSTDNAGLAIARAVAVVHVLRADPRLRGVTILPLSGAQMIVPNDRPALGSAKGDDQSRRRIEIRLRRSSEQASTNGAGD
jgi:outer membrane protein OmpA-like peptidoglycan-associated protein